MIYTISIVIDVKDRNEAKEILEQVDELLADNIHVEFESTLQPGDRSNSFGQVCATYQNVPKFGSNF